jgi:predicted porin
VPLGVALLSGPARAEVSFEAKAYGFLNIQLEAAWANGGATPYRTTGRVSDGNSRIGFTGSMALGEKTRVIVQIEAGLSNFEQGGLNDQGQVGPISSRNTFLAISDDRFGVLRVGNNDSAYRTLIGSAGEFGGNLGLTRLGLDLWNNTSAQLSGNPTSVFSRGEARYTNSVHYQTPSWQGFQLAGSYSFDELNFNGGKRDRFALAAVYRWGGLTVGVGLDYQLNTGVDADKLQQGLGLQVAPLNDVATYFYKALASYRFPTGTFIAAGLERSNYGYSELQLPSVGDPYTGLRTGVVSQFSALFSAAQEIGDSFTVMVSFGRLGNLDSAAHGSGADFAALQFSGGVKYAFNQHFAAYAYYTYIQNGAQQQVNFGQSPLYTNNTGTTAAFLAPGNGPNAAGLGAIARF